MDPVTTPHEFQPAERVLMVADLAGFTRLTRAGDDLRTADMLHAVYSAADRLVAHHGGQVIKFLGDSILAEFPDEASAQAVSAARRLRQAVSEAGQARAIPMRLGVNLHRGTVIAGIFGTRGTYDLVGAAVNHAFMMGCGDGIRCTQPVYDALDPAGRAEWELLDTAGTWVLNG